ncbi:NACHT domain-containing protein [Leptothermofonsia sichuanensis E412]|uniref:helix-turn-helix domain-containing protein n=1 Tax=Leptothermofonsia sichuanensis TaxID=2917832 RepID=UPI001CA6382C|nr:helix-turn-helix domain-containing protein [Leptothermofonsia sichuanensis]QZZ20387.1 NACHT domain-containing protein [Leptothermofonsia sichuanensis E412]
MAKPSLKATPKGVQLVKQALIRAGWTQKDLQAAIGCSRQPITNFFKGEAIAQPLFMRLCDRLGLNWQAIVGLLDCPEEPGAASLPELLPEPFQPTHAELEKENPLLQGQKRTPVESQIDLQEVPNLPVFYGRVKELTELKQRILEDACQLVVLLGMRGIGKTTLAVRLLEEIKYEFDYVIWRSLAHTPPPLMSDLLADLIQVLSNQHSRPLPATSDGRISCLIEHLRQHRCLLVLDNAESLMQDQALAGHYRPGYEDYEALFRRLGTGRHQSCLILTSRANLKEIAELEARDFPVYPLHLAGLPESYACKLLAAKGLSDQEHWGTLIEIFQGNPLALQIVSAMIQRSFGGRVSHFLKQKTITTRQIVDLLEQQFHSLSALEKELMYCLAIQPQPMSFADLKEQIEVSGAVLLDAVESLLRRSLIRGEARFTLEPVVRQYVINELEQQKLSLPNGFTPYPG